MAAAEEAVAEDPALEQQLDALNAEKTSGARKAAIAILALGEDMARELFAILSPDEVERIVLEASTLRGVTADEVVPVLDELVGELDGRMHGVSGHEDVLRTAAAAVVGDETLAGWLSREVVEGNPRLEKAAKSDPAALARTLAREHPQVVAVVLAMMSEEAGGAVLQSMPLQLQTEVVKRLAQLKSLPAHVMAEVSELVGREVERLERIEPLELDGLQVAVGLLKSVNKDAEEEILDAVKDIDEELAETIKSKLFVFDDLIMLDKRQIQQILGEVDKQMLPLALKKCSGELKAHILGNMSSRARELILDDLEAMGPTPLAQVEEAQGKLVAIVVQMASEGKLELRPGSTV